MNTLSTPPIVVAAILRERNAEHKILIVRRGAAMTGAGFWEFPGGKVEPGESEAEALKREISEELSLDISVQGMLSENIYQYPTKTIHLKLYWTFIESGHLSLIEHDAFKWVAAEELVEEELSMADRPFVVLLQDSLKSRS